MTPATPTNRIFSVKTMLKINICELFEISPSKSNSMTLIKTPFEFEGTNDKVVVRVRPVSSGGYDLDDGGDTTWFLATGGYQFDPKGSATSSILENIKESFNVELDNECEILQMHVNKESDLPQAVINLVQASTLLFGTISSRIERAASTFKEDLRTALYEIAEENHVQLEENPEVSNCHGLRADYLLKTKDSAELYLFAASDKARVMESSVAYLSLYTNLEERKTSPIPKVMLVVESQSKVGKETYERAGYFSDRCIVYDKQNLPSAFKRIFSSPGHA